MLDICLLGTGGMMPLLNRYLTSLMVRCDGSSLLIDCGEATQLAIKKAELTTKPIDYILFTHFHADHISGLPGLLLEMKNSDRVEPVTIAGPKGVEKVVNCLRVIANELPFEIKFIELDDNDGIFDLMPYRIQYFKLKHKLNCIGYNIFNDRLPQFLVDKAKSNNVPLRFWNKLQHGESCVDKDNGLTYTPDMVMGGDRKGLKITYLTDTRPCENIYKFANDSDLFICEGMYGDDLKENNAKKYLHMTMDEACEIAIKTNPKEMWLTHYSPSEVRPKIYEKSLKEKFENIKICKDGEKKVLNFED